MLKTIALTLILAAPVALADKSFTGGKGAAWDCAKDPNVNIAHGRGNYTFKGACKQINLNGGESTIAIESVDQLNVNGGKNTITVGEVDQINLVGAGNTITYKKGKSGDKPAVSISGTGNKVGPAGDAPADKPAEKKAAPAGAIDCSKQADTVINDGDGTYRFVGACEHISVNGGDNKLEIESVKELAVAGADNAINVGAADKIGAIGDNNQITYKRGLSGAKPKISTVGTNNKITQAK